MSRLPRSQKPDLYRNATGGGCSGFGYGCPDKALYTIALLNSRRIPLNRQIWTITNLYNRAKYHPNQTVQMLSAMSIFKWWMANNIGKCTPKPNRKRTSRRRSKRKRTSQRRSRRKN